MGQVFSHLLEGTAAIAEDCEPASIENPQASLYPEELKQIEKAVAKRRLEFSASRILARKLLAELGREPTAILSAESRAPVWPEGVVGSITHTKNFVAVALASAKNIRSIGIDAEEMRSIKESLWPRICSDKELASLRDRAPSEVGEHVGLLFSAKEAFYKAQHPLTATFLGFHDVEVHLGPDTFEIELLTDASPEFTAGMRFPGKYTQAPTVWASAVIFD